MNRRRMLVGAARSVEIPVTLKGSRAVIKIYSDLRVEAQEPRVWYNMGLAPTIAMVGHQLPLPFHHFRAPRMLSICPTVTVVASFPEGPRQCRERKSWKAWF